MGISVFVNRSHFLQQQRVTTVGFRLDCVTLHGEEPDFTLASYRALFEIRQVSVSCRIIRGGNWYINKHSTRKTSSQRLLYAAGLMTVGKEYVSQVGTTTNYIYWVVAKMEALFFSTS